MQQNTARGALVASIWKCVNKTTWQRPHLVVPKRFVGPILRPLLSVNVIIHVSHIKYSRGILKDRKNIMEGEIDHIVQTAIRRERKVWVLTLVLMMIGMQFIHLQMTVQPSFPESEVAKYTKTSKEMSSLRRRRLMEAGSPTGESMMSSAPAASSWCMRIPTWWLFWTWACSCACCEHSRIDSSFVR